MKQEWPGSERVRDSHSTFKSVLVLMATLSAAVLGLGPPATASPSEDPDAWVESACAPRPMLTGPGALSHATQSGICVSAVSLSPLTVATYTSERALEMDLANYRTGTAYAVKRAGDYIWIFLAQSTGELSPLSKYGFQIGQL